MRKVNLGIINRSHPGPGHWSIYEFLIDDQSVGEIMYNNVSGEIILKGNHDTPSLFFKALAIAFNASEVAAAKSIGFEVDYNELA